MSRTSQLFARVLVGSCLCVLPLGWALTADRAPAASRGEVLKYEAPSGETYLAIGLRAPGLPNVSMMRHHVVLVDTSASQFGEHRARGFAMLQAFLGGLPKDDLVSLLAVDVQAARLTPNFVAPDSDELRDAIVTLQKRVPLGATNFQTAIDAALDTLQKDAAATVLYVGDGMSIVNLLSQDTVQQSLNGLRTRQVPFSSFAVGPRHDLRLLGVLAQHTGGVVMIDRETGEKASADAGRKMAKAATANVFFPDRIEVAGSDLKLATTQPLPLRTDRDTIVLAQGHLNDQTELTATGKLHDQLVRLNWLSPDMPVEDTSPFLATAFRQAGKDKGLVPYAGQELLNAAKHEFQQRLDLLAVEGSQAVSRKQFRDAERVGKTLQELDPHNANAKVLLTAAQKVTAKRVSQQASNEAAGQPAQDSLLSRDDFQVDVSSGRSLILDEVTRQKIIGEKLQLEVSRAIQEARAISAAEPDAALTLLKRAYGSVRATVDASIDLRQQLGRQLQSVIADVRSQMEVSEQAQIHLQERVSVQEAEKRLLEKLQLEDEKLEQLIDRVRALLEDGARGNDDAFAEAEAAAEAAVQMRPNNIVSNAARFNSEAAHQLNMAYRLRNLRAEKFLATLEQVEFSHVPFPDEPPVLFPPADVWKALTERRKPYASVDLHKSSPAERRIAASLDEQTEVAFADTPLVDVVTYLQEYHGIPIILDEQILQDAGIATDLPITRTLSGVTLRSALKIILQPHGLSYVIEDEVMKITTVDEQNNKLQTRVYPVGDLVVQLMPGGGGGGGGLGGGGQGGGGFGGGGQGGGGLGGGGFGGGGQGGGGGFFNLPVNLPARPGNAAAPANVAPLNNEAVNAAKKKLSSKK